MARTKYVWALAVVLWSIIAPFFFARLLCNCDAPTETTCTVQSPKIDTNVEEVLDLSLQTVSPDVLPEGFRAIRKVEGNNPIYRSNNNPGNTNGKAKPDTNALAKKSKLKTRIDALQIVVEKLRHRNRPDRSTLQRRAAVLYQDKGGLEQIQWFLKSWHVSGASQPTSAFDVIIFAAPTMVDRLPSECTEIKDASAIKMDGLFPGRCLTYPLVGISHTDPLFENQHAFNSMQALATPKASFLAKYSLLLRTDSDTFLTPKIVDWWPKTTQIRDFQGYGYNPGVKQRVAQAARRAGLRHYGHSDLASSWYGPSDEVIALAQLTMAAGPYLIEDLFGDSPCKKPQRPAGANCRGPFEFTWGTSVYEGVVLLYAQELAVNHIIGDTFKPVTAKVLDHPTETDAHICTTSHLHVHHGTGRFSKMAFAAGEYRSFDLSQLDLRLIMDYATYIATVANGQGLNAEKAVAKLATGKISDICRNAVIPKGKLSTINIGTWCIDRFSNQNIVAYGCQAKSLNQLWFFTDQGEIRLDDFHCLRPLKGKHSEPGDRLMLALCPETVSPDSPNLWLVSSDNRLKHKTSGLCLQADAKEQQPVVLQTCDTNQKRQIWDLRGGNGA